MPLLRAGNGVFVQAVIILRTVSFPAQKGVEVKGPKSRFSHFFFFFLNLGTGGFRESSWPLGSLGIQVPFSLCRLSFKLGFLALITGKSKDDPEFLSKGRKG